jgi:hypothetical protein
MAIQNILWSFGMFSPVLVHMLYEEKSGSTGVKAYLQMAALSTRACSEAPDVVSVAYLLKKE